LIDLAAVDGIDPVTSYRTINQELTLYSKKLAEKEQIIVLNKIDLPQAEENLKEVKKFFKKQKKEFLVISAVAHKGTRELVYAVWEKLNSQISH
jgi:GTP-binding protein